MSVLRLRDSEKVLVSDAYEGAETFKAAAVSGAGVR
jgi:hypothetical protein